MIISIVTVWRQYIVLCDNKSEIAQKSRFYLNLRKDKKGSRLAPLIRGISMVTESDAALLKSLRIRCPERWHSLNPPKYLSGTDSKRQVRLERTAIRV